LKEAGFDVVSTGNNHALDRYPLGVDLTLDELDSRGLAHTGTRRQRSRAPDHALTSVSGRCGRISIAWIACSFSDNGLPDPHRQLRRCYDTDGGPARSLVGLVQQLNRRPSVDTVVVLPHWGHEYATVPSVRQRQLAQALVDAGVSAIVGSHPHVLQPVEDYPSADGQVPVAFSLGNFVADQEGIPTRSSVVLFLQFERHTDGTVRAHQKGYLPIFMDSTYEDGGRRQSLVDLDPSRDLTAHESAALEFVSSVLRPDRLIGMSDALAMGRDRRLQSDYGALRPNHR
jgi:poly-gamma-glutamate synthesis protein (capsule biosynthesis protein)